MGSRIKENPERIFEGFFEVLHPTSRDEGPELKRQFPEHLDDQDSVMTLTKFCFPFNVESCLPWFELFYKLLNNIAECLVKDQVSEVTDLLQALYDHPVPEVNQSLNMEMFSYFVVPEPTKLPSIPENRNLTEFLVAVQVDTMLQLYASLLCERRILITASKLSTLTACVHASAALLYPMYWQHIYIPTLPPHLLDYCGAPIPFLIGVHSSLMEQVNTGALEDVVVFDMDTNNLETPFQDLDNLPQHVVSLLKLRLTKQSVLMGDGVSRAFLGAQALLFGSYREALICIPGEPITFCQDTFVNHKCGSVRTFLQNAVHLQLFTQFIDNRLEKLNSGEEFTDLFEQEVTNCGLSGASKSYQMWLENLKKGGGTLINNVKNRTNPMVRNMLKYAKGQARTGLQGMKRRIKHKDQRMQRAGSFKAEESPTENHEKLQSRLPITQHFGQSRPRRPGKTFAEGDSWEGQKYDEGKEADPGLGEDDFPLLDEGMDLLNEIFETLSSRAPAEGRALYGAHSLDCFNLDDSRYFTRFQSLCVPSDEDLQLSLSQPRTSHLWYLQEVDEGSVDYKEPDVPSSPPENMLDTSETMEVPSPTEEATPETIQDLERSSEPATAQNPEGSSTTPEPTVQSSEVTTSALQDCLPIPTGKLEQDVISPTPELDIISIPNEESKKQIDVLPIEPSVTRQVTSVTNPLRGTPLIVSGPRVRSAISRFQAPPIDPRLVWTGTKKEAIEAQTGCGPAWSFNATRPTSQIYSSPKPSTSTYNYHPAFLRTQSTPKLSVPKSPISNVPNAIVQSGAEEGNEPPSKALPPPPIGLSASSLPRVSELKKKFES